MTSPETGLNAASSGGHHRAPDSLDQVLAEARDLGLLGPAPVERHVGHARAMGSCLPVDVGRILDLGAGGGIPGLVLAVDRPAVTFVLLDAGQRRCRFLRRAVVGLGLTDRVSVIEERAEAAARHPDLWERFDAVVARLFGPPAVTAECAVGFLAVGGSLLVSEPPEPDPARWPPDGLAGLGFSPVESCGTEQGTFVHIRKVQSDDRWPRRVGIPAKRPRWL